MTIKEQNNWLIDEIVYIEDEYKKKSQDSNMTKKLFIMLIFLSIFVFSHESYALESPQARKIPISGDLWKCSTCGNLQVNRKAACEFCGNRIDRD